MPHLSHETLAYSSPDLSGNQYSLSLDPGHLKRGESYCVYDARLRSKQGHTDPKNGKIATAKFPRHDVASKKWAEGMINKARLARSLGQKFNTFLTCIGEAEKVSSEDFHIIDGCQSKDGQLTFLIPQSNYLDSVSFTDRKRKKGEYFVFEDKVKNHQTFLKSTGEVEEEGNEEKASFFKFRSKHKSSKKVSISRKSSVNSASSSFEDDVHYMNGNTISQSVNAVCSYDNFLEHRPPSYHDSQAHALHGVPLPDPSQDLNNNNADNYISGPFSFHNHRPQESRSRSSSTYSTDDENDLDHPYLQAFVHHAFCNSNGRRVVCNLKGSREKEDGSYFLSTPTIHSIDKSAGSDDLGPNGMRLVIANHTCSRLCRHLPNMLGLLNQVLAQQNSGQ